MTGDLRTAAGRLLYRQLPEEYRFRDEPIAGRELRDLEAYLHGFGHVLDLVRGTLEQMHADAFARPVRAWPSTPRNVNPPDPRRDPEALEIQPWLLPYLAELVGAELITPSRYRSPALPAEPSPRSRELNESVRWYKAKGTLHTVARITDVVAASETVVREGWKRTLITPRVGLPPFTTEQPDPALPPAPWRPVAPLGAPDLRRCDRAVQCPDHGDPVRTYRERIRDANGLVGDATTTFWEQRSPGGAPCFPGAFDDMAPRTPDLRDPERQRVGPHPAREQIHVRPPDGFFEPNLLELAAAGADPFKVATHTGDPIGPALAIQDLDPTRTSRAPDKLVVTGLVSIPAGQTAIFEDLLFAGGLSLGAGARVELRRCAASKVTFGAASGAGGQPVPALEAHDVLLGEIDAADGFALLEYVTVLKAVKLSRLHASDCIFAGAVDLADQSKDANCVRFSSVPPEMDEAHCGADCCNNTAERPRFMPRAFADPGGSVVREPAFGEPGAGVLHDLASPAIREGAEDDGEMGAYHHLAYAASLTALRRKLTDFLPLGQEAAALYDERLVAPPPKPA